VVYNFYSSGDELFELRTPMPGPFSGGPFHLEQYAWQKQEMFKGTGNLGGTTWAGWGFEIYGLGPYTATQANSASDSQLQVSPVFNRYPPEMFSATISQQNINNIHAKGIPALSLAAGRAYVGGTSGSLDMNEDIPNGWGRNDATYQDRWLHSDIKNMAYPYTFDIFNNIVTAGGLQ
jgi:hypothetical protein